MRRSTVVRLVAFREVRERARSKAFQVSTGFSLALVLFIAVFPSFLGDDGPTTYDIGVVGEQADLLAADLPRPASLFDVEVDVRTVDDEQAAERLVADGALDAAVVDAREVIVDEELGGELEALLGATLQEVAIRSALAEAGIDDDVAAGVLQPPALEVRALNPVDQDAEDREGLVFLGTVLLYGQLLGFGYWVASGLVEEKTSRVVEVLLAKARPTHLLAGKLIGIGVLGLATLLAFAVVGLGAAAATGTLDLPPETLGAVGQVLFWFVPGYALYSCMFAIGGALASRPEELQATTTPITLLAMAGFFAAIFGASDPGGTLARVTSFLPPSAPLVLPIRAAAGELPLWEGAVGLAIMLVAIVVAVRLSARVYTGAALHVRGQLKLRQAITG